MFRLFLAGQGSLRLKGGVTLERVVSDSGDGPFWGSDVERPHLPCVNLLDRFRLTERS